MPEAVTVRYATALTFEELIFTTSMTSPAETAMAVVPDVSDVPSYAEEVISYVARLEGLSL